MPRGDLRPAPRQLRGQLSGGLPSRRSRVSHRGHRELSQPSPRRRRHRLPPPRRAPRRGPLRLARLRRPRPGRLRSPPRRRPPPRAGGALARVPRHGPGAPSLRGWPRARAPGDALAVRAPRGARRPHREQAAERGRPRPAAHRLLARHPLPDGRQPRRLRLRRPHHRRRAPARGLRRRLGARALHGPHVRRPLDRHHGPHRAPGRLQPRRRADPGRACTRTAATASGAPRSSSPAATRTSPRTSST